MNGLSQLFTIRLPHGWKGTQGYLVYWVPLIVGEIGCRKKLSPWSKTPPGPEEAVEGVHVQPVLWG